MTDFDQSGFGCRLEWGWQGAEAAAQRGDILIVVDVLRFSTAVASAVHHGVSIYPCLEAESEQEVAQRLNAETGGKGARFSLSPLSFAQAAPGTRVALGSRNGAACSRYGAHVPILLAGALVNARATAERAAQLAQETGLSVTVNPCGERWLTENRDGNLRFALEDYLGAGAILESLPLARSPEAEVCVQAFAGSRRRLEALLLECGSGRELIRRQEREDVVHASQLDAYRDVPILRNGWFVSERFREI
jgi:2-phosphosulfolactate phosphatase